MAVAVLHRWIFQAMRYPPQNLPPVSHSQKPVTGTVGMGKKKRNSTPVIAYALEFKGKG